MTLSELFEIYQLERLPSEATLRHYRILLALYQKDMDRLGLQTLRDAPGAVTRHAVLLWRQDVLNRSSKRTWNNYQSHMQALWNLGMQTEHLADNPWLGTKLKVRKRKAKTLSIPLIQRALIQLHEPETTLPPAWFWSAAIKVLYYTAIRRKQLVGIKIGHLDLENGMLHLPEETSKAGNERDIPLLPELTEDIQTLLAQHRQAKQTNELDPEEQLFNVTLFNRRYKGDEMTADHVSGFFRRLTTQLGEPISAHRLRHTFATQIAPNTDIRTLQELLGHGSHESTMVYIHTDRERQAGAMESLPSLT